MGLRLELNLEGVPDEQLATLQGLTTNIHAILEDLARDLGIPRFDVTVKMVSNFAGEVSAVLRSVEDGKGGCSPPSGSAARSRASASRWPTTTPTR
jgi:hypothetical protein